MILLSKPHWKRFVNSLVYLMPIRMSIPTIRESIRSIRRSLRLFLCIFVCCSLFFIYNQVNSNTDFDISDNVASSLSKERVANLIERFQRKKNNNNNNNKENNDKHNDNNDANIVDRNEEPNEMSEQEVRFEHNQMNVQVEGDTENKGMKMDKWHDGSNDRANMRGFKADNLIEDAFDGRGPRDTSDKNGPRNKRFHNHNAGKWGNNGINRFNINKGNDVPDRTDRKQKQAEKLSFDERQEMLALFRKRKEPAENKAAVIPQKNSLRTDDIVASFGTRTSYNSLEPDLMFVIKTTEKFLHNRLRVLTDTWISDVQEQTYVVTDTDNLGFSKTHSRLMVTDCGTTHQKEDLCCKMSYILDIMAANVDRYRWFCRIDDDTYVNTKGLLLELNQYKYNVPTIVSSGFPVRDAIMHDANGGSNVLPVGSAGICLSRALVVVLAKELGGKKFVEYCADNSHHEDFAIGKASYIYGGASLFKAKSMLTHDIPYKVTENDTLDKLATINFHDVNGVITPVLVNLSPAFDISVDPTQMYTLHCHLHREVPFCRSLFGG